MKRPAFLAALLLLGLLSGGAWLTWALLLRDGPGVQGGVGPGADEQAAADPRAPRTEPPRALVVERRTVPGSRPEEDAGPTEPGAPEREPPLAGTGTQDDSAWLSQLRLAGRVRAEGVPVGGAKVTLRPSPRSPPGDPGPGAGEVTASRVTGANGTFDFSSLPARHVELLVEARGYGWQVQDLTLGPEDLPLRDVTVELVHAQAIAGRVVDVTGAPVAGAEVHASMARGDLLCTMEARTGPDGSFLLDHLVPGVYLVLASADGYVPALRVGQESGLQDLEIVLGFLARVRGRVLDSRTGEGVPAFTLFLAGQADDSTIRRLPGRRGSSFTDGRFELGGIEPGTYVLEAQAPALARAWSQPFTVGEGQVLDGLVLTMGAGGVVTGQVRDPAGQALPSTEVVLSEGPVRLGALAETQRALDEARGDLRRVRTDEGGRFRFDQVPPGRHHLIVRHGVFQDLRVPEVLVRDGQTTDLGAMSLEVGATLQGVARDERGQVLVGATIHAVGRQGVARSTTTDQRGAWRITGLAAGSWQVGILQYASTRGESVQEKLVRAQRSMVSVELAAGQTTVQDVQLGDG